MHAVNFQQIDFEEEREEEALARTEGDTKLTGLFNLQDNIRSQNVLYVEIIPTDSWDKKNRNRSKRRRRNLIWEIQWFHLHCLLLLHVPGATGYDDLKMVNAIVHNTLKQLWIDLTREAVAREMPWQLRQMFTYMLVLSNVNLLQIWKKFHDYFCEDDTHLGLGRNAAYLRGLGDILCSQVQWV